MKALPPPVERLRVAVWRPLPLAIAAAVLFVFLLVAFGNAMRNYSIVLDTMSDLHDARAVIEEQDDALDRSGDSLTAATNELAKYRGQEVVLEAREAALAKTQADLESREAKLVGAEAEAAKNEFSDGLYIVGSTVNPGTYSTGGPTRSGCYYAWMEGTGADADIVDNNILQGPGVVTLNVGDIFESSGCQRWQKTG